MKSFATLVTIIVIAVWVVAVAILSVQNATPVSLRFLTFQSIQLPVGLLLAFCAGVGMIGMALIQPLWGIADSGERSSTREDDTEFFVDEDF
ncbi:LapA family protein [Chlorogloeopsis sp. ULAP01]|uniref:LapA family protein n=1 Tax=Chlorogloeopsis sp. ULAP01 TaxID=3056483 RepID=UPI0025AAC130|nr:LapA family protein [Chlorogloeopsis sp. ULAP01]MDM9383772.1 LapA family protein [Chlorogloeopsis sp. ULAP01]